jgi:hypothetical protein
MNYILNHLQELSGLAAESERLDALLSGKLPALSLFTSCYLTSGSLAVWASTFLVSSFSDFRYVATAVRTMPSPGPTISRETSETCQLLLESLTIVTPDGSRTLCQVSHSLSAKRPPPPAGYWPRV